MTRSQQHRWKTRMACLQPLNTDTTLPFAREHITGGEGGGGGGGEGGGGGGGEGGGGGGGGEGGGGGGGGEGGGGGGGGEGGGGGGEGCDTQTASNCMKFSEIFQVATLEEQFAECANASKSVQCLEDMLQRCPSLAEEDEILHIMITRHVDNFKAEAAIVCSSVTSTMRSAVTSSLLLTLLFFCHFVVIRR
ncbi:hypothetical protein ACOMHN_025620 [Nucella lapillus]